MIILNGQKLDFVSFPNGETKVNGEQIYDLMIASANSIVFKYENDGDLLKLMFVKRFLDEKRLPCTLTIAYMPYSRMDRVEGLSVFTLKYVSEFINSLNFDRIIVLEPHSDITCALLNRAIADNQTTYLLNKAIEETNFYKRVDYLFFPDAGAQKRYGNSSSMQGFKQIVGHKKRDFDTGKIISHEVVGLHEDLEGLKVIIVDDLCSYGGTFYGYDLKEKQKFGAAKILKELGADEIYLVVAHAEYAILDGWVLDDRSPINKVFTTNTIIDKLDIPKDLDSKIKVFEVI